MEANGLRRNWGLEKALKSTSHNNAQFAAAIGVTPGQLSNWLAGREKMPIKYAKPIEEMTGIHRFELCPEIVEWMNA